MSDHHNSLVHKEIIKILKAKKYKRLPQYMNQMQEEYCKISFSGIFDQCNSFRRLVNNCYVVGSLNYMVCLFARLLYRTSKMYLILFPSLTSAAMAQSGMSRRGKNTTIKPNGFIFII